MGQPTLLAPDVPTKLPANNKGAVVRAEILVDGIGWNVTCVSMGNPHCVTFSTKQGEVIFLESIITGVFVISLLFELIADLSLCILVQSVLLSLHNASVFFFYE